MKKTLHYFLSASVAFLLFSNNSFGQVAATATWALESDQVVATTGAVTSADLGLVDLVHHSYVTNNVAAGFYNGVSVSAERSKPSAGWPANETGRVTTRYAEYTIAPATGKDLKVTQMSFDFGDAGSTNIMRAEIYYSTDNFVTETQLNSGGTINLPKFTTTGEMIQVKYTGLSILVANTKTLKVRVYPWWTAATSTSKYLVQRNIVLTGVTGDPGTLPLPLDFLSVSAKPDALGKTVNLNWATTNEINTANFEIQKKIGTADFVTIGKVNSKNTAGNHNYSFVDENATSGTAYYRVLQFDNDGASTISKIQVVSNKATTALSIYPNPVGDVLNVNHASANQSASYKVLSLDGKVMFQQGATANTSSASINVSQLTPGAYMLVFDNNGSSSVKFIKK